MHEVKFLTYLMFSWAPYAFVRIVILYTAGILLGIYYPDIIQEQWAINLFLILTALFVSVGIVKFRGALKFFNPGLIGLAAIFLAGYIQLLHSADSRRVNHFIHYADTIRAYKAVVRSQPNEKENSWKIEASVTSIQGEDNRWIPKSGKVLLYLSKKDFSTPYQYGDVLLIESSPQLLTGPANPGEFDYKRFLTFRKTYHQHFLRKGSAKLIDYDPPNALIRYAIQARVWAALVLKKNIDGEREQGIASALVLGVTDGLDNELIGAYSATGAMHVLAVSGLHVGIIYLLISFLLKPLNNMRGGNWLLAVISILLLWTYAFITGLSPSVLRAVTMFSFVAIARPAGQRTNIYNTLAASAFCLLLFEPYLIMSVGFQLSYLAVIGIVYLHPMLYRVWEPESILLDKVWQITCVSIAAQVATFSLGLLYFHQFPVYFLFSNLFVIPGATAILILGIIVVITSFIAPVAFVAGFILEWLIRIVNFGVFSVESFPYSLIDHVFITTFQCWLLILAILSIFLLIEFRKFRFVLISFFCLMTFSALQWNHYDDYVNQQQLVVYKVSGHSAFDLMDNGKSFFFSDSVLIQDQERMRFHIRPNRLQSGIHQIYNESEYALNFKGCRVILWKDISILQIYEKEFSFPPSLSVDYLIIGGNSIRTLASLPSLKFRKLILDSSNSSYFAYKLWNEAKEASLNVHSVLHQNAFIVKL